MALKTKQFDLTLKRDSEMLVDHMSLVIGYACVKCTIEEITVVQFLTSPDINTRGR